MTTQQLETPESDEDSGGYDTKPFQKGLEGSRNADIGDDIGLAALLDRKALIGASKN